VRRGWGCSELGDGQSCDRGHEKHIKVGRTKNEKVGIAVEMGHRGSI